MNSNLELLTPFIIVAYSMWATPGPNNMMLTYLGARFGLRATTPHLAGVVVGAVVLNLLAILGLKPLIAQWPQLMLVLKVVGSIWLVIIGWKMAHTQAMGDASEEKPMRFFAALMFQFANPKAISATLALVSLVLIALEQDPGLLAWVILVIPIVSFVSIFPWAVAGRSIRQFLSTPLRWKIFSRVTGGLTAACAIFLAI